MSVAERRLDRLDHLQRALLAFGAERALDVDLAERLAEIAVGRRRRSASSAAAAPWRR